jgi:hypothetical protein
MSLFIGYDLQGYIDNTIVCSSSTLPPSTSSNGLASVDVPNPIFWHWLRQDKLILFAIFTFVSESVIPLIAASSTTHEARSKLQLL